MTAQQHAAEPIPGSVRVGTEQENAGSAPRVVIEPSHGLVSLRLHDLWQYRDLLFILAWRDIKVRYKQTALGAAWAIVQPVFNMIVFTVIFGHVAKLPSDGVPYALFTLTALLPWQYFSYVLTQSGESLVENARMISKVYFPRLVLPLSAALAGLMDFAISFVLLAGMLLFYHIHLGLSLLALPLLVGLAIAAALSVGIWLSALNVRYRDVRYTLPFLTQILLYVSPVAYSGALVKGPLAVLYALNPMVGVIDGFRWALLGRGDLPLMQLALSTVTAAALLLGGLIYFRRMEQTFADLV